MIFLHCFAPRRFHMYASFPMETDGTNCEACHAHNHSKPGTYAKYYCPMCAGVESANSGECPKCGMALERNPAWTAPAFKPVYTCPMHPEVRQDHPGSCPICGMALELAAPAAA